MASAEKPRGCDNTGKRLYIRTFGCQMNVRDSEMIYGMLLEEGFKRAESEADAGIMLFNTCSVRKHAEDRVWGKVGMLARNTQYASRNTKIIGIIGCMAQSYKEKIFKRLPNVDFICGPANIYDIPKLIKRALEGKTHLAATNLNKRPLLMRDQFRQDNLKAHVNIMYGCDNFCSYCIVPYVRGREISRPKQQILEEIKHLAKRGIKEVTLLGQNVNSYRLNRKKTKSDFVELLEDVNEIKGIERIRFVTSHPKDTSPELCKAMRDLEHVCEHLHLPLQSGSERILKLMQRGYRTADYLKLVEGFKKYLPQGSLSTDIMVGFPGELEKDFQATRKLMQKIKFDEAFIFKYCPRPPAKSAQMPDEIPIKEKQKRNQALLALQEKICLKKNKAYIGRTTEVLTEGQSPKSRGGKLFGRTRTNKVCYFGGGKNLLKALVNVKILSATPHSLKGDAAPCRNSL